MLFCHLIVKVWPVCLFHSNGVITTTGAKTKRLARNFYSHFVETMADHTTGYSSRFSWRGKQYQVITNKQNKPCINTALLHDSSHVSFTDDIKPIFAPTHSGKKCSKTHSQAWSYSMASLLTTPSWWLTFTSPWWVSHLCSRLICPNTYLLFPLRCFISVVHVVCSRMNSWIELGSHLHLWHVPPSLNLYQDHGVPSNTVLFVIVFY